jgi:hypothetical protein
MRLIIAGSRDYTDYTGLCAVMRARGLTAATVSEVISGNARGADQLGERWAADNGVHLSIMAAKWRLGSVYNPRAGLERNAAMADRADALIAFWDGYSNGTRHMITTAKTGGLPVTVVNVREGVAVSGDVS